MNSGGNCIPCIAEIMEDVPNADTRERCAVINSSALERYGGGGDSVTVVKYEVKGAGKVKCMLVHSVPIGTLAAEAK